MKGLAAAFLLVFAANVSLLHSRRQAPTDLQIGSSQFISYQELLHLPQVSFKTSNDSNFSAPAEVSGVPLERLRQALHGEGDMVIAICADGYRTNYPASYLSVHHPVLVLKLNGHTQESWPQTAEGGSLGPYLIANPNFIPSFQVLSHSDEAQIPFQVTRLDFRKESEVFGAIAPQGNYAATSPVMNGFAIAKQNCYRCHNMGAEGGQMASIPWPALGAFAKSSPEFFARYVRTPQAVNPHSRMAASPQYDDQTIAALEAYFSTFAAGGK
jgi:mono/diheme cytochrome c family protein